MKDEDYGASLKGSGVEGADVVATGASRRRLDLGMWCMVPGRPHLAWLYCEGCERYSRKVLVPTDREKADAFPLPMYPEPPKGWEHGCPRCDR